MQQPGCREVRQIIQAGPLCCYGSLDLPPTKKSSLKMRCAGQHSYGQSGYPARYRIRASFLPCCAARRPAPSAGKLEYASPIQAESLAGLPAAYIETAEFDCLRDGGILYDVLDCRLHDLFDDGGPGQSHDSCGSRPGGLLSLFTVHLIFHLRKNLL